MVEFLYVTLATLGVSALIADYDGPFEVFSKIRRHVKLARCTVCLSVWVGIVISLLFNVTLLTFLATLGLIILIERLT